MRVLHAIAGARHGGAESFFERLALALARPGLSQVVAMREHAERVRALSAAGVPVTTFAFGGRLDRGTVRGLRQLVERVRPDVALSWMSRASRALVRARRGGGAAFVLVARLGGYYDLKYYRGCDHLVGNTADIVDYIRAQGWPPARVHYLPNFVDSRPQPPVARGAVATPDDAPLILALGRLHGNKGFDVLLEALAALPRHWLWLAGEGPLEARLRRTARRLGVAGRVRFLGWRDDVPALFAAADLFVCPSRNEPLGNVVIEAWAHGVPVVASASAGPGRLVTDGVDGLLAPVDDAAALARAIAALDDRCLAAALVESGRAAYLRDYTRDAVVARYIAFFESIAPRASGRCAE